MTSRRSAGSIVFFCASRFRSSAFSTRPPGAGPDWLIPGRVTNQRAGQVNPRSWLPRATPPSLDNGRPAPGLRLQQGRGARAGTTRLRPARHGVFARRGPSCGQCHERIQSPNRGPASGGATTAAGSEIGGTALIVIAQSYYHNWQAYVDGRPVQLLRANYAFQACQVPTGGAQAWACVYQDSMFWLGLAISGLSLAASSVIGLRFRKARAAGRLRDGPKWNPLRLRRGRFSP